MHVPPDEAHNGRAVMEWGAGKCTDDRHDGASVSAEIFVELHASYGDAT